MIFDFNERCRMFALLYVAPRPLHPAKVTSERLSRAEASSQAVSPVNHGRKPPLRRVCVWCSLCSLACQEHTRRTWLSPASGSETRGVECWKRYVIAEMADRL